MTFKTNTAMPTNVSVFITINLQTNKKKTNTFEKRKSKLIYGGSSF